MINFDMKTLGGVKGLFVYNASFKTFVASGHNRLKLLQIPKCCIKIFEFVTLYFVDCFIVKSATLYSL